MVKIINRFLILFFCVSGSAATYNLPDAAQATFDAQLSAASAGDTIIFPLNGSATWSASSTVSKAVVINGNGTTLTAGTTLNTGFFYLTNFTTNLLTRITGFTFNLVDFSPVGSGVTVANSVGLGSLRVDHNVFNFGYNALVCYGAKGVIDNNYFYNSLKGIDYSAGSRDQADASWISMSAGTGDALFIENNHFIDNASYPVSYGQEKIGTENGGKLVVRFNEFDSDNINPIMTDGLTTVHTHGSAPDGGLGGYWESSSLNRRGQSVVEVYGNYMHGTRVLFISIFRGSANLVYSNTAISGIGRPGFYLREEEWQDGWSPSRTDWPAEDQINNSFFWNNFSNGTAITSDDFTSGDDPPQFIQLNRDFFVHAPQSSGGYEYFTGVNGASGAYPTDGNTYPTLGTMAFSVSGPNAYYGYAPYQYPHPLTLPPPNVGVRPVRTTAGLTF